MSKLVRLSKVKYVHLYFVPDRPSSMDYLVVKPAELYKCIIKHRHVYNNQFRVYI